MACCSGLASFGVGAAASLPAALLDFRPRLLLLLLGFGVDSSSSSSYTQNRIMHEKTPL
jgi:hypothetical protein